MKRAARRKSSGSLPQKSRRAASAFEVPDLFSGMYDLVRQIPAGQVATYGQIAVALGNVRAARWVATCLLDARCPADVPAHRVVSKDGGMKGFRGKTNREQALWLRAEEVDVAGERVEIEPRRFVRFQSAGPLAELQRVQGELLSRVSLVPPPQLPEYIGGVDVSYAPGGDLGHDAAVAAFARVELATGRLDWSATVPGTIRFPYIPGFLAFREIPLLLELLAQVRTAGQLTDVVLVDGNGILHQRHAGIATHLGIIAGIRTIGIGKSLLCGKVDVREQQIGEQRPVILEGQTVATAIRTGKSLRPIYISPGQGVDVAYATDVACRVLRGHRVPEPIYHAHHLSRAEARAQRT